MMLIKADLAQKITFATTQNHAAILHGLTLVNQGAADLKDLRLSMHAEPPVLLPKIWAIDALAAESEITLSDRDVRGDRAKLSALSERLKFDVVFQLTDGETTLAEQRTDMTALARHEWGGAHFMPELLAAFILPNDPTVAHILKDASGILAAAGRKDAIDGYQSGSRGRSWELVAAIWAAVAGRGFTYAEPPTSFETQGQKVRTPGEIADQGLATCLDVALLFAAAVELAGLNAVVALVEGHAFVGAWLQPETLPSLTVEDPAELRKAVASDVMVLFEATLALGASPQSFEAAMREAGRRIAEENEEKFVYALDIKSARSRDITPIPTAIQTPENAGEGADGDTTVKLALSAPPDLGAFLDDEAGPAPETPVERVEMWKRRLLDLSRRNRLLNVKPSRGAIPVFCPDPAALEDRLAAGDRLSLVTPPAPAEGDGAPDPALFRLRTGNEKDEAFASEALGQKQIVATIAPKDLEKSVVQLYRKARAEMEEGGSNTLFLALGMLRWTPPGQPKSTQSRAPLLLVPVKLVRGSARSKPRLERHEDDTVFNLTLLELLRQSYDVEIPELADGLPEDDSGVDVRKVWEIVRRRLRDVPDCEVTEDVLLSTFSFAKYLMWKDLSERTDQLKQSPFVRRLIDRPDGAFDHGARFMEQHDVDRRIDPAGLYMPLNADSSQIVAVHASAEGGDFVLEGPPGTGKSETIANIIAHNLGLGRRVLFVSEKMAALDVVYRRLKARDLGDFCLEAHSNKAGKKAIIDQLGAAWTQRTTKTAKEWTATAKDLREKRDALNGLVAALHRPGASGVSPRQAIGRVVRYDAAHPVNLDWGPGLEDDKAATPEGLDRLRQGAIAVGRAFASLRAGDMDDFAALNRADWSNAWTTSLTDAARALLARTESLRTASATFQAQIGTTGLSESRASFTAQDNLAAALPGAAETNVGFALDADGADALRAAADALEQLSAYQNRRAKLTLHFADDHLRSAPFRDWSTAQAVATDKPWPLGWFAKRAVAKQAKAYFGMTQDPDLAANLPILEDLQTKARDLAVTAATAPMPPAWRDIETDVDLLGRQIAAGAKAREAVLAMSGAADAADDPRGALRRRLVEDRDALEAGGPVASAAEAYRQAFAEFDAAETTFADSASAARFDDLTAAEVLARAVIDRSARLRDWCAWVAARQAAAADGLGPVADAVAAGLVPADGAAAAFETAYCRWLAPKEIDARPDLVRFQKRAHEDLIADFRALDQKLADLTSSHIRARISGAAPAFDDQAKPSGGYRVLAREMQKKQRHMPVRRLMGEMGDSLFTLTPCVLMSPLSVAQFLPADQAPFDLVVFDEASQITVWDAIGAVARGKSAIVVGDPKQMPPTNFFNKAADAEDLASDYADLDSILEEAMAAQIPQHRLTGHYRSRHESLIAFSNHAYYDNRLITYPSAETKASAVSLRRVSGVYAKGAGRTNPIEGQAIVDDAVARMKDPSQNGLSIGIVTLNAEQQRLIEDLLDDARRSDPDLERFFDGSSGEPVFVKNLETVQGDQRDVILFSVGYGPTSADAPTMSMNFGPLNREGGERRLNVAITRATTEVVIFASFDAAMIDLSRTQAAAVRDLKAYMDFAERGPVALGAQTVVAANDQYDSDFEYVVAEGLRRRGWTLRTQVGVSKFRLDIGVVDPDAPGRFLAGIECDGAAYHSAPSARDRDRTRQAILERLGWRILRIWSTDFFLEPEDVLDDVHRNLTELLQADRAEAAAKAAVAAEPCADDAMADDPEPVESAAEAEAEIDVAMTDAAAQTPAPQMQVRSAPTTTPAAPQPVEPALPFTPQALPNADGDRFHDPDYTPVLRDIAIATLDREAPITFKRLAELIARQHGFKRTGAAIKRRIWDIVRPARRNQQTPDGHTTFWPEGHAPETATPFRGLAFGDIERPWADVPYPEKLSLAAEVLAAGAADPAQAMSERIGLGRRTSAVVKELEALLNTAREKDTPPAQS